jgi:hypothetical protein
MKTSVFGMLHHVAPVGTDVSEKCIASIIRVTGKGELGAMLAATISVPRLLVTVNFVPSQLVLVTLMIVTIHSSETSVLTRATRRHIPKDSILRSRRRENLKSYTVLTGCALQRRLNVYPVRYELGFYNLEDGILHSRVGSLFSMGVDISLSH